MKLVIQRESHFPTTMGKLSIDGVFECDTLELPWKDNRTVVSCIPAGTYPVTWEPSFRLHRHTLRLQKVPGRRGILIHPGNSVADFRGCIGLGKRLGRETLTESRAAVSRVEEKVRGALWAGEAVTLEIKDPEVVA